VAPIGAAGVFFGGGGSGPGTADAQGADLV
jgi:hypothetical protein